MIDKDAQERIDQALIIRVKLKHDQPAFEQLVRRHQSFVRGLLRRLLRGDHAAADDLAQECFIQAWRKIDQFRGEARFATWLYRIAYTLFLKYREKHQDEFAYEDETSTPAIDSGQWFSQSEQLDLRLDFEHAMQHLNERERIVLYHCVQLELSHEEIAQVLGLPLGTVKSNVSRGKAKLQNCLMAWKRRRENSTEEQSNAARNEARNEGISRLEGEAK